jgi:PqqD family protein of HPr-rel-A system
MAITTVAGDSLMQHRDYRIDVNEAVVRADVDDEAVLLHVETGIYFGLDALGAHIWRLLTDGATEGAIVAALLDEYEVEPARLRADLAAFLDRLAERGLTRVTAA